MARRDLIRFCRSPSIIYRKPQQVNIEKSMEKVTWPLSEWMISRYFKSRIFHLGIADLPRRGAGTPGGESAPAALRASGRWRQSALVAEWSRDTQGHRGTPRNTETDGLGYGTVAVTMDAEIMWAVLIEQYWSATIHRIPRSAEWGARDDRGPFADVSRCCILAGEQGAWPESLSTVAGWKMLCKWRLQMENPL